MAEFRLCRDQVPAEPFAVVRRIVEADLGMPLEQQFSEFDRDADRGRLGGPGPRGASRDAARPSWSRCSAPTWPPWSGATSPP